MKIAQIASLIESVPPRFYGGSERVVSYLTEELVNQGHDVTLFASGDSITAANLVPCCTQAVRLDPAVSDVVPYYMLMRTPCASPRIPLKIAAKIDKVDEPYFREVVQLMLSAQGVEFIGEISEEQKGAFLRDAIALLFPICWPEPFGSDRGDMSHACIILAYRAGSVPDVIDEGVTGMMALS